MKLNQLFLEQLDNEAKSTRRVLERVPEGRNDWKPHPKSMALGYLAALVAKMPAWLAMMIDRDEYELSSQDAKFQPVEAKSSLELLESFDEAVAAGRRALENASDEHLLKTWRFLVNGHVATESARYVSIRDANAQPLGTSSRTIDGVSARYVSIRDAMLSHWAHHRGQLTVYLRLNEAPVPAIYGPSADDRGF